MLKNFALLIYFLALCGCGQSGKLYLVEPCSATVTVADTVPDPS